MGSLAGQGQKMILDSVINLTLCSTHLLWENIQSSSPMHLNLLSCLVYFQWKRILIKAFNAVKLTFLTKNSSKSWCLILQKVLPSSQLFLLIFCCKIYSDPSLPALHCELLKKISSSVPGSLYEWIIAGVFTQDALVLACIMQNDAKNNELNIFGGMWVVKSGYFEMMYHFDTQPSEYNTIIQPDKLYKLPTYKSWFCWVRSYPKIYHFTHSTRL